MWRAFFLAAGGILIVMGVEALVLDHAVLAEDSKLVQKVTASTEPVFDDWGVEVDQRAVSKTINPPEWAPWSLLSSGAVILFYAVASKVRGGE